MNSNECEYCSNEEMHWLFEDKQDNIAFGAKVEQECMKFAFQYGSMSDLKISWNGFIPTMKYCPWCGRQL